MNVLSLFDGMSCGQLALKKSGIEYDNYYASEIDSHAIKITRKNFPNTHHIGSVMDINTSELPQIDLLIGGSPCQSFTFAGKRVGMTTKDKVDILSLDQYLSLKEQGFEFEGESYLFWEYIRVLKEVKPKYFLLENVRMEKKWKELISKVIETEPVFINSNILSAQNRQRLYWTNIPIEELPLENNLFLKDIVLNDEQVEKKFHLSYKHHQAFLKSYNWKHCELNQKSKPLLASYYKQPPHCPYIPCSESDSGFRRLLPIECERLQCVPDGYTEGVSDTQRYKMIGNGWTVNVIAHIFKGLKNG
jgi:DNA (cytosine-5)-methyltransferase 3A